ncbi:unnamed protein product [Penicillium bialowiezense]
MAVISFRDKNHGLQVGDNHGSITAEFHLPPGSLNSDRDNVYQGFFYNSHYESYKNINPSRVKGTCAWFLKHATFQKWKDNGQNDLLWLSADPGCGKSVLSRALADENLVSTEPITICYFFFKDNDEQNKVQKAMCALLHQLFQKHEQLFSKYGVPAVKRFQEGLHGNFEELWRIFLSAATDPSTGSVVCILDALDECEAAGCSRLIDRLQNFYDSSLTTSAQGSSLKFLVTSRPYDGIVDKFAKLTRKIPTIRLAGEEETEGISEEITVVIKAKVAELAENCNLDEELRLALRDRLCEIPNRTYLWLHLTFDAVEKGISTSKTRAKLRGLIDNLSESVEDAYEEILAKSPDREKARQILQLIIAARRPLAVSEIDIALEIKSSSSDYESLDREFDNRADSVRQACGLFVSIIDSHLYLIHQTAREFLTREKEELSTPSKWKHSIDLREANSVMSEKCVIYLHFHEFDQNRSTARARASARRQQPSVKSNPQVYDFLDYTASNWISHIQEDNARNDDSVSRAIKLCDIGDGSSHSWFKIYTKSLIYDRRPFNTLKRPVLYWTVVLGLIRETRYLLERYIDHNDEAFPLQSIFQDAIEHRSYGKELTELFLVHQGDKVVVTEYAVNIATKNKHDKGNLLNLLLDLRGDEVEITEELVLAAAANEGSGKEVMKLLLERRGHQVRITDEVVETAAGNESDGVQVLKLLLDLRRDEVKLTDQVLERAAGVRRNGKNIIELLLDTWEDKINITDQAVEAALGVSYDPKKLEILLYEGGDKVRITTQALEAIAGGDEESLKLMESLLVERADQIKITEQILEEAAGNWKYGKEMMELLLGQRGDTFKITDLVTMAAATNENSGDKVVLLILDKRGDEVRIGSEIAIAAIKNQRSGKDIITLLLTRRRDEIQITPQLLIAAAEHHHHGKEILELLLGIGEEVQIDSLVIMAAVKNEGNGRRVLEFLLDERHHEIIITAPMVEAAALNWGNGEEVIKLLCDGREREISITENVMKAAASNDVRGKDIIAFLLNNRNAEVKITEQILLAATRNWGCGLDIIKLLVDKRGDDVEITTPVVVSTKENSINGKEILKLFLESQSRVGKLNLSMESLEVIVGLSDPRTISSLLNSQGKRFEITEKIVMEAAANQSGEEILSLLLDQRGSEVHITEQVLIAAAGNEYSGDKGFKVLLNRLGNDIKITLPIVNAAANNLDSGMQIIGLVAEKHVEKFDISVDCVSALASSFPPKVLATLLNRRGNEIQITDEIVAAAASNEYGKETISLLFDQRESEVHITEQVLVAAAGNGNHGRKILSLLLERRGGDIKITPSVMEAASQNFGSGEMIMRLLVDRCLECFDVSTEGLTAVAEFYKQTAMAALLHQRGNEITITDQVVEGAAKNIEHSTKVMRLLLDQRGDEVKITERIVVYAIENHRGPDNNQSRMVLQLLVDKRGQEVKITEKVVKAIGKNYRNGHHIMRILLEGKRDEWDISVEVLATIAGSFNRRGVAVLLDHEGSDLQMADDKVVEAAAGNWSHGHDVMKLLLDRRGDEVKITANVVEAARNNVGCGDEIISLLLDRREDEIKPWITRESWNP